MVCRVVRHARESERTMRLRFRETEKAMEHLKRRLKLQGIHNVDGACGRIRVNPLLGSRKTTPFSSRENSPGHLRHTKTGSRASSCPTFGSQSRPKLNLNEELRLPIYKEYLTRTPTSLPSSARFRDSPGHGSSRSARQGDYNLNNSPKKFQPLHGSSMQGIQEMPKEHHDVLSRTSSPRQVLREVKAKLAEYARIQGISLCAQ